MDHDDFEDEEDVPPPPSWRTPPDPFADEEEEPPAQAAPPPQAAAAPRPQLAEDDGDEELDPGFDQLYPDHGGRPLWQRLDKRAVIVAAAVVAVLLWLLVGLGGGKKHTTVTTPATAPATTTTGSATTTTASAPAALAAFRRQADASCTSERRTERALTRRYGRARSRSALLAYSRALTASFAAGQARLGALQPPSSTRALYRRWLAQGRQALALERRSTAALAHGRLAAAAALAARADHLTAASHPLARRLGFTVCGR